MSHFTVLIIGENPEEQLIPYQENNMGDCPKEYLKFHDVEDKYKQRYIEETVERIKLPDNSLLYKSEPNPEQYPVVLLKVNEMYPSYEQYLEEYHGYTKDKEMGKYGYWENPNAKWDWYMLGGRWGGMLRLKNGEYADQAYIDEIDFEKMYKEALKEQAKTWKAAQKEKDLSRREFLYGVEEGISKEDFMKRTSSFCTFAVVKDGQWYERGEMGWWGCVSDEKNKDVWQEEFNKLLSNLPKDTLISIVDCHI